MGGRHTDIDPVETIKTDGYGRPGDNARADGHGRPGDNARADGHGRPGEHGPTDRHGRADDITEEILPAGPEWAQALTAEQDAGPDMDLTDDPFDDNLAERLAAAAPRRIVTRSTLVFAGIFLVVAGFLAGTQVQQRYGTSTGRDRTQGAPFTMPTGLRQFGQTPGAAQGNASGAGSGSAVSGKIKLVDGTTIYVETSDGKVVTVRTTGDTAVRVSRAGAVKDLPTGATISVEGQTNSDGTVKATKVTKSDS